MRGMANYQQKWHFEKHRSTYPETEIVLGHEVVKGWHIVFPRTNSHIQGVKNGRNEQQYARSHVRPKRWKRELFEKHQRHFALLIILDEEEVKQSYRKERKGGKIPSQRTEIKFLAECKFSICPVRASRMVTSRHPWRPWIRVFQRGGGGGGGETHKPEMVLVTLVKSDIFLRVLLAKSLIITFLHRVGIVFLSNLYVI